MSGFERDYLDDIERDYENENIEPKVEKSKFNSSSKKKEEAADIEEAVLSSIGVLDELLSLGEDVEEAINGMVESRCIVIKKLRQDGKLNGISDELKDKINTYIEQHEQKNNYDEKGR